MKGKQENILGRKGVEFEVLDLYSQGCMNWVPKRATSGANSESKKGCKFSRVNSNSLFINDCMKPGINSLIQIV